MPKAFTKATLRQCCVLCVHAQSRNLNCTAFGLCTTWAGAGAGAGAAWAWAWPGAGMRHALVTEHHAMCFLQEVPLVNLLLHLGPWPWLIIGGWCVGVEWVGKAMPPSCNRSTAYFGHQQIVDCVAVCLQVLAALHFRIALKLQPLVHLLVVAPQAW